MKKFIATLAAALFVTASLEAAPKLGVTWRAPANAKTPGVKIFAVEADSNAEELGLEVGDFVLSINDKLVRTGAEATAAVVAAKGKLKIFYLSRNGRPMEIAADIDAPTQGFTANPNAGKYKNIVKKKK